MYNAYIGYYKSVAVLKFIIFKKNPFIKIFNSGMQTITSQKWCAWKILIKNRCRNNEFGPLRYILHVTTFSRNGVIYKIPPLPFYTKRYVFYHPRKFGLELTKICNLIYFYSSKRSEHIAPIP